MTPWFDLHAAGKFLTVSSGQGGSTEKNGENGNMGMDLRLTLFHQEGIAEGAESIADL